MCIINIRSETLPADCAGGVSLFMHFWLFLCIVFVIIGNIKSEGKENVPGRKRLYGISRER